MQTDALEEAIDNLRKLNLEKANLLSKKVITLDGWKKEDIPELFYQLEKFFIQNSKLKDEKEGIKRDLENEMKNLLENENNLRLYIAQKEFETSQMITCYEQKFLEMTSLNPYGINLDESSINESQRQPSNIFTEQSMLDQSSILAQENSLEYSQSHSQLKRDSKQDSISKKRQAMVKTKSSKEKKKIASLRDRQKEQKLKEGKTYQSKI